MQMPPIMQCHDAYFKIRDFCAENRIYTISPDFFTALEDIISANDIVEITPRDYVVAPTKEETLNMYRAKKESWGIHLPFFIQTRPGCVFYIFRTSSDALWAMMRILTNSQAVYTKPLDRSVMTFTVLEILEHVVDANPCYALCDLDDYPSRYQGRLSDSEIEQLTHEFIHVITTLLITTGSLDPGNVIEVKEKKRSRHDRGAGQYKMSKHKILSLFAEKSIHKWAFTKAFEIPFKDGQSLEKWLKDTKKRASDVGNYDSVDTEYLKAKDSYACLLPYDFAAPPGGPNGISTFFSKKRRLDPAPRHGETRRFSEGRVISLQPPPFPEPHEIDSEHISVQGILHMFWNMSYSIPKATMTFYTHKMLNTLKMQHTNNDTTHEKVCQFIHAFRPRRGVEPRLDSRGSTLTLSM